MSETAIADLPLWVAVIVATLLVLAGLLSFLGALGLLRLANFYQRVHAPSISITLGTGCMLMASMMYSSWQEGRPVVHELAITALILLTAPVVAMMLMRAAVYRDLYARQLRHASPDANRANEVLYDSDEQVAREAMQEKGIEAIAAVQPSKADLRKP